MAKCLFSVALLLCAAFGAHAFAQIAGLNPLATQPLSPSASDHAPGSCHVHKAADGYQLPDPSCTPGAVNPTLTVSVLLNSSFRTSMVRDKLTSEITKRKVYAWYGITLPTNNTGTTQTCELDHLIDLASGGADSLDNIWPQCQAPGAAPVLVGIREFKIKDRFAEHNVMAQVKAGADLATLQREIAADWTQFIPKPGAPQ